MNTATATIDATPVVVPEVPQEYVEAVNTMAAADIEVAAQSDGVYELGLNVGRMELATFFGQMSDIAVLAAYEEVKKSKAWKSLRSKTTGHFVRSLDEFCQERLGYSERHLRRIAGNRELIGQEAFEQAERLGLRQVDYNLPEWQVRKARPGKPRGAAADG